jgi:hypothetical protein
MERGTDGRQGGILAPEAMLPEVERILQSDTFRQSDALRRLLKFLAERSASGDSEQLKEYSIAVDALGKPPTYDPRNDSTVRIQAGRLRHKLAEYYRGEGKDDEWIVELPKGRFKLTCEARPEAVAAPHEPAMEVAPAPVVVVEAPTIPAAPIPLVPAEKQRNQTRWLAGALIVAAAWAVFASFELWNQRQETALFRGTWTPELEQLWRPFLAGNRPSIISIADPPFVQFAGYGAYREITLNTWEDIIKSPAVSAIRKALNNPEIHPNVYYAAMGEVNAAFYIGKLLGPRVQTISLVRVSELSMQQLADNNVVFIGGAPFFVERLRGMPIQLDFDNSRPGIVNLHPRSGEPAVFADRPVPGSFEDGEVYVLITHAPGPNGTTDVESFTSTRTPARFAAVQWFTDQNYARILVSKLKKPSGELPRYYQLILKVRFKDGVPTDTSYVLHHELGVSARQ